MSSVILIGTPCFGGQVSSLYTRSVLDFQKACLGREGVGFDSVALWGDSLITRARQGLVTQLLVHPTATHLLFADGDVGFEPNQVFRLLDFDADIAAAAVPGKHSNREEGRPPKLALDFDFTVESSGAQAKNGFVKARSAGTGLMLIKRAVLKAMTEKYQDLRYKNEFAADPADPRYWSYAIFNCLIEGNQGRFLSEDESFCHRWTEMGGEIWVDLESGLKVVGPTVFRG
jgi:hypothetical protein